jgi:uncharacterized membrane protein
MALKETIEIGRPPQEVFDYVNDVARHPEWQVNLLDVKVETEGPVRMGTRVRQTRRVGGGKRTFTLEVTGHDPPSRVEFTGIDGPIRPHGKALLEPIEGGQRTRFTNELEFKGHGFGILLVPLVRRDARKQLPENLRRLKQKLESA